MEAVFKPVADHQHALESDTARLSDAYMAVTAIDRSIANIRRVTLENRLLLADLAAVPGKWAARRSKTC